MNKTIAIILGALVTIAFILYSQQHQINNLKKEVACLKSPTSQTSSIGPVTIRNGKLYGKTTATVVSCP